MSRDEQHPALGQFECLDYNTVLKVLGDSFYGASSSHFCYATYRTEYGETERLSVGNLGRQ